MNDKTKDRIVLLSLVLIVIFTFGTFVVSIINVTKQPTSTINQNTERIPIEDALLCFSIDADVNTHFRENNSETNFHVSFEEILESRGEALVSDTWLMCFYEIDYTYWNNNTIFTIHFNCLNDPLNTTIITFYTMIENETHMDDDDFEFLFLDSFYSGENFIFSFAGYGLAIQFLVMI